MNCQKCNNLIQSDWILCPYCGKVLQPQRRKKTRQNGTGTIYKEKNGTYRATIVLGFYMDSDGKMHRKTRSKRGFKTKKEAIDYLPFLINAPHSDDENIKFRDLFEKWLPVHSQRVGKSTMDCYKAAYKHYEPLHYIKFSDIKTDMLQSCVDNCNQGKRTKQNMKVLGTLLYKFAMQRDIVSKNYAQFIYTGNDEQTTREAFTKEEIQQLFDSVPNNPNARYVLIMCYTGFRPEEFLKIQQKDFDRKNNTLTSGSKTEAGRNRIVPISKKVLKYILELANDKEYIFSPNGEKMSQNTFRKNIFYPALELAHVRKLSPYSCRHTFATLMKDVNAPATDKQKLIGHANFEMTAHYTHTDLDSLRKIIENL